MADLKLYDKLDLAPLREYFMNHGERRLYRRGQHFITIGRTATEMGLVVSGGFAFSHPDYKGDRQILTLAFAGELVGNYITPDLSGRAGYDATAMCESEVLVVPHSDFVARLDSISSDFKFRFTLAIAMSFMMRATSIRCDSPETRYRELLRRMPEINGRMSMTAIASYLGISRETFARLRNRLRTENRDSDQNG